MLAVGDVDPIIDQIVEEARKVIPGKNLGAVISQAAKERIESYITEAEHDGAKVLVDGRGAVVEGKENGTYVGPPLSTMYSRECPSHRRDLWPGNFDHA